MSALYTAVKLGDAWRDLRRPLTLDGAFDAIAGTIPPGEHRGLIRLVDGQEVGFRATIGDTVGPDGLVDMEVFVDDANVAKLAKAEAEVARLRAALVEIRGLQPCEPDPWPPTDRDTKMEHFWAGREEGKARGRYEAAEMAQKALVSP